MEVNNNSGVGKIFVVLISDRPWNWQSVWQTLITNTVEAYLTDGKFQSHISFFVYTFWKLLNLRKKLNIVF